MNGEWFAGRLKELREAAGLTQSQLSDKSGISRSGIADLEQGRNVPSWDTALKLADALGVSLDKLRERAATTHEPKRGRPVKIETPKPRRRKK